MSKFKSTPMATHVPKHADEATTISWQTWTRAVFEIIARLFEITTTREVEAAMPIMGIIHVIHALRRDIPGLDKVLPDCDGLVFIGKADWFCAECSMAGPPPGGPFPPTLYLLTFMRSAKKTIVDAPQWTGPLVLSSAARTQGSRPDWTNARTAPQIIWRPLV